MPETLFLPDLCRLKFLLNGVLVLGLEFLQLGVQVGSVDEEMVEISFFLIFAMRIT